MKIYGPLALLLSLAAGPALAHAHLVKAEPAAGSIGPAPTTLTMYFTESVAVPFCTVTVTDSNGSPQQTAKPQAVPGHDDELAIPLHITAPGTYHVTWHALSTDTHKTHGSFTFTVSP